MNAEKINLLLEAWNEILTQICRAKLKKNGDLFLRQGSIPVNNILVSIGITKGLRGDVLFSMNDKTACAIASTMMGGMPINDLDDLAKSAICELGNIMMGNTASKFANTGLIIDITPPRLITGDNMSTFSLPNMKAICIPMQIGEIGNIEVNVTIAV